MRETFFRATTTIGVPTAIVTIFFGYNLLPKAVQNILVRVVIIVAVIVILLF